MYLLEWNGVTGASGGKGVESSFYYESRISSGDPQA